MKSSFTREYILSIKKSINSIGCWIPKQKPKRNGYVQVSIDSRLVMLHRVVMSLWHNIDYNDISIETRHNTTCDRRCFNPEHVKPGTHKENMKEHVHHNSKKDVCPKCGGHYTLVILANGLKRRCNNCRRARYNEVR